MLPHCPEAEDAGNQPPVEKRRLAAPEKDKERNAKRRQTTYILDRDAKDTTDRNIILSLLTLLEFLEENFVCKRCHKCLTRGDDDDGQPQFPLSIEMYGLATCGINFDCQCSHQASLRPDVVPDAQQKIVALGEGKPYANRLNAGDFEINRRLQLGLQLCGSGRQDGSILAGSMLKLNVNPMQKRWTEVQELLGKAIIVVGNEVLEENLDIECQLSPIGVDGRPALDIASDTRWDKRGSTRRYDSSSGCAVAFGLRSNLPLGIEPMSTICIKCKKGHEHDTDVCSKNYNGTAKGMEATGAAKIVSRLFANEPRDCYVANLVTDDDSLVRKILTHSFKELLQAERMTDAEWPRTATGRKKPDNGLLPLLHGIITFLADKGQRVRGYSRFLFLESAKSVAKGWGCTKVDAERMKRRLSWTLRLHCHGTYEEFKTAVLAVLEHHFDNHEFGGDWCQFAKGTDVEVTDNGL
jgi:hypothetical protein